MREDTGRKKKKKKQKPPPPPKKNMTRDVFGRRFFFNEFTVALPKSLKLVSARFFCRKKIVRRRGGGGTLPAGDGRIPRVVEECGGLRYASD